jgi:DNA-binding Lrp family transcriptional regulator
VITGFTALVDPAALGQNTEAFIEIHCSENTSATALREALLGEPEIVAAYTVTGEADALVHLLATDVAHLEATVERIRANPGIARTKTIIVLSRLIARPER